MSKTKRGILAAFAVAGLAAAPAVTVAASAAPAVAASGPAQPGSWYHM